MYGLEKHWQPGSAIVLQIQYDRVMDLRRTHPGELGRTEAKPKSVADLCPPRLARDVELESPAKFFEVQPSGASNHAQDVERQLVRINNHSQYFEEQKIHIRCLLHQAEMNVNNIEKQFQRDVKKIFRGLHSGVQNHNVEGHTSHVRRFLDRAEKDNNNLEKQFRRDTKRIFKGLHKELQSRSSQMSTNPPSHPDLVFINRNSIDLDNETSGRGESAVCENSCKARKLELEAKHGSNAAHASSCDGKDKADSEFSHKQDDIAALCPTKEPPPSHDDSLVILFQQTSLGNLSLRYYWDTLWWVGRILGY
ncbi:MAG: hypothetical protein Q9218_007091 [Villophora microphyllina]